MEEFNCQKDRLGLKFCFFFYIDRNESEQLKGIDSGMAFKKFKKYIQKLLQNLFLRLHLDSLEMYVLIKLYFKPPPLVPAALKSSNLLAAFLKS